jgi:membrane-associated phospholipid phosphatase
LLGDFASSLPPPDAPFLLAWSPKDQASKTHISSALLTVFKNSFKCSWCGWLVLSATNALAQTPNTQGQSGYINMPSAWVEPDGTISTGYGYDRPYGSFWASATVLPFLQVTGRYVSINGIPGFTTVSGQYGSTYGRYKDKVVDAKLRVSTETAWLPTVAIGKTDLFGTELFKGTYVVASKTLGSARNIEASIGYGRRRPDGIFAGMRWVPSSAPRWALVAEYDANDYKKDFRASETAAGSGGKGPAVGLEYRWGWLGAQVARHRDHFSANAFLSVPFSEREFIPKLYEPAYFQQKDAPARVTAAEWQKDGRHGAELVQALVKQDFKNVRVELDGTTLNVVLTNSRISNMGRAIGRASRTALAFAPEGTRSIHITYTKLEQPIATYEFFDLQKLTDYLTSLADRESFLETVLIRFSNPADRIGDDQQSMLAAIQGDGALGIKVGHEGDIVQLRSEDREASRFKLMPKLSFFFNDPSGALRYEVWAAANYDKRLGDGLYLSSDLKLDLFENVSGVTQPSNSLLPHVRTEIAAYKRGGHFKLNRLLMNKYVTSDERIYARVSGGFYEEMYRGFGGQVLYLPKASHWAADVSVDALQQRGYRGWFDKLDYKTVTALGALHYQLPYDITATARAGRFLARDEGVRLEFKRRFLSGVEFGVWYTKTNGRDITNPGTPTNPYHDKGVFLSIPLNVMLPSDTQATADIGISPWTRDVGQMVASPGDLYDLFEQPRRDMTMYDGLGNFAERADEQNLAAVNPPVRPIPSPWPAFRWRLEQSRSSMPTFPQWMQGTALAAGAVATGALLDKPVDRFVEKHEGSSLMRGWSKVGKMMPVALAGAAAGAVAFGDVRMQNIGLISLESIAGAAALSIGTKRIVGRARPSEELGPWKPTTDKSNASFPSNHSTAAFAAVTPFAQEYDAPWLYGLAALSSMGRIANRQHWVSDVVGGGVIGYAVGSWLWKAQRSDMQSQFAINTGAKEIGVAWRTSY